MNDKTNHQDPCLNCAPGIECIHINKGGGPPACPWFKQKPMDGQVPRGSVLELTITQCADDGTVYGKMTMRLVMHYIMEGPTMYEVWDSPDFPLPQEMISEILIFLEEHVCSPVSQDKYIKKAEIPASLIIKLLGPQWFARFRQLSTTAATRRPQIGMDDTHSPT